MINLYLFVELLGAADPNAAVAAIKKIRLDGCKIQNVVQLAEQKLVAHVDCKTGADGSRLVLEHFMSVDGIVQTNIIAAVRPTDGN